jgi:phosphopantetheinyl transferase
MEKLDTSHIAFWPETVALGSAIISNNSDTALLTPAEKIEYAGFSNPKRKAEFLAARQLFHWLLHELKLDSRAELKKEATGKPFAQVQHQRIHVSFSHTPQKVFCALSPDTDIGLDVEQTSRKINPELVSRILNAEERLMVGEEPPITLWTIKEAAVKCMGTGLRTNLNDLTITKNKKNRFTVIFNDERMFEICSFRQLDHQIALAY